MRGRIVKLFAVTSALTFLCTGAIAQISASDRLDCLIQPHVLTKLGSPINGILEIISVARGDFVKQGEVLGKLESGVEIVNVELARARVESDVAIRSSRVRLDFRRRELDRIGELYRKKVATQKIKEEAEQAFSLAEIDLLEAQAINLIARLELRRAEAILEQRTIVSPIDGVVVERALSPGEFVHEQAHIVSIAQIDPLRVEVFVPIALYGTIEPGMQAEVMPEAPSGGIYLARVTVVDQVFDAASGTFGVRMEISNPSLELPAGLKCTTRFLQ